MRIGFVSYEYPPDTAVGGIATYVHQAARMLARRGHEVHVFAGSETRSGFDVEDGVNVYRLRVGSRKDFPAVIAEPFLSVHRGSPFDLLEGPDYGAEAAEIARRIPDLPFVMKLHTPTFLVERANATKLQDRPGLWVRSRRAVRALWRGKGPPRPDPERLLALQADEIASPSKALGEILVREWGLEPGRVFCVPYPFQPPARLLTVPPETATDRVTFIGRLEGRKGVLDLALAIPRILRARPSAKFRLIGEPEWLPDPHGDMRRYLERQLASCRHAVEFTGALPYAQILSALAETDICVFPSIWENFPNVCLEAMSAARGIVGSSAGGMSDMLDGGQAGVLVPPRNPKRLAAAVIGLLSDPERRMTLGRRARRRVVEEYDPDRIGALQEASYARAIRRKRKR